MCSSDLTFMAILQEIDLSQFHHSCQYPHGHVLWADIVTCDANDMVSWLESDRWILESPFSSFAGKEHGERISSRYETPPWKKPRRCLEGEADWERLCNHVEKKLPELIMTNDTIIRFITRAQYSVLLEVKEMTLDLIQHHMQQEIDASPEGKISLQALGQWILALRDMALNRNKYRDAPVPQNPRNAWPW